MGEKITIVCAYAANGLLASLTDDNENRTTWAYDVQNRKQSETKGIRVSPASVDRDDADTTLQWS